MKTPLTSILGYSDYLQNAKCSEEERMNAAGHLHDATKRLENLSTKLLELTYLRDEEIEQKEIEINDLFSSLAYWTACIQYFAVEP